MKLHSSAIELFSCDGAVLALDDAAAWALSIHTGDTAW
jgi:hypothetical protein